MSKYLAADDETGAQSVAEIVRAELSTTEVLTADVLAWLAGAVGDLTVGHLAAGGPRGLNVVLRAAGPQDGVNTVQVAGFVFAQLADLEVITTAEPAPAAGPPQPLQVEVAFPKRLDEMSVRELLELLAAHPDRYSEIAAAIEVKPEVVKALAKTPNWVVTATGGGIDVEATVRYLAQLGKEFAVPQRSVNGVMPVTLPRVFGQQERPLFHPFTLMPITGPDSLGYDWGTLDEQLHKALLWAQATGHEAWPATVDAFTHSAEVFQNPLPPRWQRILDDYERACADDESNIVASRYYSPDLLAIVRQAQAGGSPFAGAAGQAADHDDAWYESQLRDVAQAAARVAGSSLHKGHAVILGVSVRGGSASLNSIVLGDVYVAGGSLSGTIYQPNRASVTVQGGSNSATAYNRSWKKLYELADEWGLIDA